MCSVNPNWKRNVAYKVVPKAKGLVAGGKGSGL